MTEQPGGPAEAAFAVAPAPQGVARRDRHVAGGRKEGDGGSAASWRQSELLPEMADELVAGQPSPPADAISWGEIDAGSRDAL